MQKIRHKKEINLNEMQVICETGEVNQIIILEKQKQPQPRKTIYRKTKSAKFQCIKMNKNIQKRRIKLIMAMSKIW